MKCILLSYESLQSTVTRKMVGLQHMFGKPLHCTRVVNYEDSQQRYLSSEPLSECIPRKFAKISVNLFVDGEMKLR